MRKLWMIWSWKLDGWIEISAATGRPMLLWKYGTSSWFVACEFYEREHT